MFYGEKTKNTWRVFPSFYLAPFDRCHLQLTDQLNNEIYV